MSISKRNHGIDLLRIVSMLMVVILHILGHGGLLSAIDYDGRFAALWFLEILAYPAVNCFMLISGYVGYRPNNDYPKLKNLISLFFTVLFYSVLICLIFKFFYPADVSKRQILYSFLPIVTKQYWFFSCYFAVFLLSPVFNIFVDKASKKTLIFVGTSIFTIFSLYSLVFTRIVDVFSLGNGFSFIWLSLVYILGGIIKKLNIVPRISKLKSILMFFGMLFLTWCVKVLPRLCNWTNLIKYSSMFVSYLSPTILIMAIALLCFFANFKIKDKHGKFINFFSSSAFSVYLIHENFQFRTHLIIDTFARFADNNPFVLMCIVVGNALAIFVVCSLLDKIREGLFWILKIDRISLWIEALINKFIDKICNKFPE